MTAFFAWIDRRMERLVALFSVGTLCRRAPVATVTPSRPPRVPTA